MVHFYYYFVDNNKNVPCIYITIYSYIYSNI